MQLGVQHVDDAILKKVNRGHGRKAVETSLRLLKDACYKVDVHLMQNLPGATVEKDMAMFDSCGMILAAGGPVENLSVREITPWTIIKQWYDKGKYIPYPEPELKQLLIDAKAKVPWIR